MRFFNGLITKNNNMELKDLEEMFKMEQELDVPHRDRWYNKDFDKRELEAEQSVKNCNIPHVSNCYMADCLIQDSCLRFKQQGCDKDCKLYM